MLRSCIEAILQLAAQKSSKDKQHTNYRKPSAGLVLLSLSVTWTLG
jgi:hypothetical protein